MTDADLVASLSNGQALALTVWGEARGESLLGQIAVGCVIRNRVRSGRFGGTTYRAVCLAPAQFSCWSAVGGEANHAALMDLARALMVSGAPLPLGGRPAAWIADGIMDDAAPDVTHGATHYLTRDLFESATCPAWAKALTVVAEIDHQVFLR